MRPWPLFLVAILGCPSEASTPRLPSTAAPTRGAEGEAEGEQDRPPRPGIERAYRGPPFVDGDLTVDRPSVAPGSLELLPELEQIRLPPGYQIGLYAEVPNARSLAWASDGTLFVSNRTGDKVWALRDEDGDHRAEKRMVVAEGLRMPNGVAVKDGDLFVAEVSRVWRYPGILKSLPEVPEPVLVSEAFPEDRAHGWKFIKFGPDGKLYVPVGAPCNICKPDFETHARITRMNPDGSELETVAIGVRNTVGFDWHPETKELWFTDNGRDRMGDNQPPCELNRLTKIGQHFGYPHCHGGFIEDPEFGEETDCEDFTAPAYNLGPHVAPLGIEFYTGEAFPAQMRGQLFIAEHGSWNRSQKIGYRVSLVRLDASGRAAAYEVFAKGWLQGDKAWGRPVDVEATPDGALLISDDAGGRVYRISYEGEAS